MAHYSISKLSPQQKLEWFQKGFRPHFEEWVVKPAEAIMRDPGGKMPAFVWLTCAIDWIAAFRFGESTKNNVKEAYTNYIDEYFPKGKYSAQDLYDSLRNGLVHMYTIKGSTYALIDNHPDGHLKTTSDGQLLLNLEDFFADFVEAKNKFFDAVEIDPALLDKVIQRYEREGFLGLISFTIP